jgi:large conductance mechanosensitive channel
MKGFRTFLIRGNVVDLAVGVVVGVAFGAVVTALVNSFIKPLISLIAGNPNFDSIGFDVNGVKFPVGQIITALVMFLLTAASIYFLVVLPMNTLMARVKRGEAPPDPATKQCPECLSEIPIAARRCSHCTSVVVGATSGAAV